MKDNKIIKNMNKYKFWRLVAVAYALYCVIVSIFCVFFLHGLEQKIYLYAMAPMAVFVILSVIHQLRFPLDLRLYVIWVYFYSYIAVAYGSTAQSIIYFVCASILGYETRWFRTNKTRKFVIFYILYGLSFLFQLRLPANEIIDNLVEFFLSASAVLVMRFVLKHMLEKAKQDIFQEMPKEDINDYFSQYDFTERDKVMLQEVLNGCKYEEIAINHKLSLSSVKKRLAFLYKVLGVTCQIDFIIKFSNQGDASSSSSTT